MAVHNFRTDAPPLTGRLQITRFRLCGVEVATSSEPCANLPREVATRTSSLPRVTKCGTLLPGSGYGSAYIEKEWLTPDGKVVIASRKEESRQALSI